MRPMHLATELEDWKGAGTSSAERLSIETQRESEHRTKYDDPTQEQVTRFHA